jgi:uncharacterized protein YodC (DUF2158 family)
MSKDIKAGDVVQLKSGSAPMTVVQIYGQDDNLAEVVWMTGAGDRRTADIPMVALRKAK